MLRAPLLLFGLALLAVAGAAAQLGTTAGVEEDGSGEDQAPLAAWEEAKAAVAEAAEHVALQLKEGKTDAAKPGSKEKLQRTSRLKGLAEDLDRLQEDAKIAEKELPEALTETKQLKGLEEETRRLQAVRAYDKLQSKEAEKRANNAEREAGQYAHRARLLKQRLAAVRQQLAAARGLDSQEAARGRFLLASARGVEKSSNASEAAMQATLDEANEHERRAAELFRKARDLAKETKARLRKTAAEDVFSGRVKASDEELEQAFHEAFHSAEPTPHSEQPVVTSTSSSGEEKQPGPGRRSLEGKLARRRVAPAFGRKVDQKAFDETAVAALTGASLGTAEGFAPPPPAPEDAEEAAAEKEEEEDVAHGSAVYG